jgi:hypothetical protein
VFLKTGKLFINATRFASLASFAFQGKVSRFNGDRECDYFLGRVLQVRQHLCDRLVRAQIEHLAATALEIYNRCDNRRRMGQEVVVLCFLVTEGTDAFHIPEKYHSNIFVLEMLVSCR